MKFDLTKPLPALPTVTKDRMELFFAYLETSGRIRYSAIMAGMEPWQVSKAVKESQELQERKLDAMKGYCELIDAEIHRRAVDGVDKGIYFNGRKIATEKVYSDRLLELLAKANDPKYRDKMQVDANVKAGVLVVQASLDPDDWEKEYGGGAKSVDNEEVIDGKIHPDASGAGGGG